MKRKKKIIFVHFFNSFSGSPKVLENVINVLKKENNCLLITNQTEGFLDNVDVKKKIFNFNLSTSKIRTLYNYFLAQFSIFYLVFKNIKKGDILYVNTTIPMFAAFAAKLKRGIIVFHLHEDRSSLNFIHKIVSSFRKYCCDHEIFVSNYLKNIEHINGISYDVLPNVLSEDFVFNAEKNTVKKDKKKSFNVLMICSLKKYKGIDEFIKVCHSLITEDCVKFSLVLGEDDSIVESYFKSINTPKNLKFYSKTYDTASHYRVASLLLNLSRPDEWVETFGLTILEGMTYGLPCIVPNVGGPIELVINEKNGYTISSYNTKLISEKILKLYKDDDLYNKMSINSKKASNSYTFANFGKKLNNILNIIYEN